MTALPVPEPPYAERFPARPNFTVVPEHVDSEHSPHGTMAWLEVMGVPNPIGSLLEHRQAAAAQSLANLRLLESTRPKGLRAIRHYFDLANARTVLEHAEERVAEAEKAIRLDLGSAVDYGPRVYDDALRH